MDAVRRRVRLGWAFEWVVAASFLVATVGVVSLIVRELRTPPAGASVQTGVAPSLPSGIPARAISVPVLLLLDGRELRVGETLDAVSRRLGTPPDAGPPIVDHGPLGDRLTRHYDVQGTRFTVVFEPFERGGVLRVAGIYLE